MKTRSVALVTAATLCCAAGMAQAQSFMESFDDITTLPANDWFTQNNSNPTGVISYFQGNLTVFGPQATAGYLGVNYNSTAGLGTISNWMLMPTRALQTGQTLNFWTRTVDAPAFPDRLQVRMSLAGASTNVGASATDVGDFTTLLLDINPTYTTTGYPNAWTQNSILLTGVATPTNGRLAFRYFVENAGPSGSNSDYIGIDEVEYIAGPVATGACCLTDGSCVVTSSAACVGQGGTYRGDNSVCATANCPQPATGACCLPDSTCALRTSASCASSGGVYRGDNTTCATANCHVYSYTGGPVPVPDSTTANVCGNPAVAEIVINDSFIITDAQTGVFIAHTWQGDVNFKLTKVGGPSVTLVDRPDQPNTTFGFSNDNYGASATSLFRNVDSAASTYDTGAPGAPVNNVVGNWKPESPLAAFIGQNAQGTWRLEVADCYPGDTGTLNNFVLFLEGPSGPAPCYANCDGSTTAPILNVNDFICFQTKYAAQDPTANCDGSTTPPVLNVNDFICFQTKYAAGCP